MSYSVKLEDIPEEFMDFASVVGYEMFFRICEVYGGHQIYFPKKDSLVRKARDREIRERFNGGNYGELSKYFGLTINQIRNIVK